MIDSYVEIRVTRAEARELRVVIVGVQVGIPGFGDGRRGRRLSRSVVLAMTLPQLQVIVNDMLTQIECTCQ